MRREVTQVMQQEMKSIVQSEVMKIATGTVTGIVQQQVTSIVQQQVAGIVQEQVTAILEKRLSGAQHLSPNPSYADIAHTPPGSHLSNLRTGYAVLQHGRVQCGRGRRQCQREQDDI